MSDTDLQLLARYTRHGAEDAFAELVRRHLDLVFSAAIRQVRSPQLAEEVAQSAFTDLARQGHSLAPDTILTAWLYQVTRRTAIDVVRREARRQLREQVACDLNAMNTPAADWSHIEPLLDEAMHALEEADRTAVLLRYFENKSLREVGQTLGTNEDAARKRVSRAVERLREFFAKRGVTVGASGLVIVISANAVQAAPVGLAVTISAAAATLVGTGIAAAATATATKAIAMTTPQKTLITATIALAVGTGIYEAHNASTLRTQVQTLQNRQKPLVEQFEQLKLEREDGARQVAALRDDNDRLNRNTSELLRLRGEITQLRREMSESPASKSSNTVLQVSDPKWQSNWAPMRPFDLAQFPNSATWITRSQALDVGIATPAALLQTWSWAQRTSDAAGLLKSWDFPEGTTEEQKLEHVKAVQMSQENARKNPDRVGFFEEVKLRDLFSLGDDYYLAFIEEKGPSTGTWIGHQTFRRVGDEWKVCNGKAAK